VTFIPSFILLSWSQF